MRTGQDVLADIRGSLDIVYGQYVKLRDGTSEKTARSFQRDVYGKMFGNYMTCCDAIHDIDSLNFAERTPLSNRARIDLVGMAELYSCFLRVFAGECEELAESSLAKFD